MATKLTHEIRREITIGDEPFTVVISPQGLRLSRKRFRSGRELTWESLWRDGTVEHDGGNHAEHLTVTGDHSAV
jgi:hypothetical protein